MTKYLYVVIAVLVIACAALFSVNKANVSEVERLKGNQSALLEDVQFYKTEAGANAASVQRLELTQKELINSKKELLEVIDDLNVKLKRAESVSATATSTVVEVQTIVRDTIIHRDSSLFKLQNIDWEDAWVKVRGTLCQENKKLELKINSVDTLYQVVHRVPYQFLFFKCGTKAIKQEIRSSNPHTSIVYSEYIELKK